MILVWGLPSEGPIERVHEALHRRRAPVFVLDQRCMDTVSCEWEIVNRELRGQLTIGRSRLPLNDIDAVYTRALDIDLIPSIRALPEAAQARARAAHDALAAFCELTPARVVNRARAMASNGSKPFQLQAIARCGFRVPETIVTNDPDAVRAFRERHGRVVYKSASGIRSIVRRLDERDEARLEHIRWCPVQFQEEIDGCDVRVHVVGTRVFATAIRSEAVDYRYAGRDGLDADLEPAQLPVDVEERCVRLAQALDLPFAGIDLRLTEAGEAVCFEVNPSPGFSYFEAATGQAIADALAAYLMGVPG